MAVPNRNKYDRQLRIWGDQGQSALEQANICLVNCGPTGAEALKNLVLGGIGSFTIIDASKVEAKDLGNNFLVDWESNGLSKAKSVSALVQEFNDSVKAKFVEESAEALLESNPSFFSQFTIVIATQMREASLLKLDAICRQHNVTLLMAQSYGLTGLVRISIKEHWVIESKPDNVLDDLRLHKPWEELKRFVDEFDVDIDDSLIHKHIPFAVLLIKATEEWQKNHGGSLPSTSKERTEFKAFVSSTRCSEDEDNYKEALSSAYKVWSPPTISADLRRVLEDNATAVHSKSSDFWVLVAALKEFIAHEGEGDLPLDGAIPDMTSLTEYYVKLQKIYQDKAEAYISVVEARVKQILRTIGRDSHSITRATIKQFCKNTRNIRVFQYPSLEKEFSSLAGSELSKLLSLEENSNANLYVLLRGVDHFASAYNRYPGVFDEDLEEDVSKLKAVTSMLLNSLGVGGSNISEDLISEMCRFGASEIHNVSSIIGGIASQEAIKLITKQFTPLSGTLVYNGIDSTSSVFHLGR